MKSPISEIIEIDSRACEIVREQEDRSLDISEIIQKKKDEQYENIMAETQKTIDTKTAEIISAAKVQAAGITENTEKRMQSMAEYGRSREDEWAETMYERITGEKV